MPQHLSSIAGTSPRKASSRRDWLWLLVCVISSFLCALYLACFLDAVSLDRYGITNGLLAGSMTPYAAARVSLLVAFFFLVLLLFWHSPKPLRFVVRWRYPLAAIVLVLCVAFRLSGSSIAEWSNVLGGDKYQGVLFGIPRWIRLDEWRVLTPFAASQTLTGFPASNSLIRATATDMTLVYAQPAWAIATLFRPTLWGYFFLGFDRGISFFWAVRLLGVLLVTFECARLFTSDDALAVLASLLVGFSGTVQWWFAVNGMAELFIYGQGLVLTLNALLEAKTTGRVWFLSGLLGWLLCCYAFILYPAWQIPLAYVFGSMGVWVLVRHLRSRRDTSDSSRAMAYLIPLTTCVAGFVALSLVALYQSRETLLTVLNTVYPGRRSTTGGGLADYLGIQATGLSSAIKEPQYSGTVMNVCEASTFLGLFPIGLLAGLYWMFRERDGRTLCLLVPYGILALYAYVGLPEVLAKITLLSHSIGARCSLALGYLDVFLLVRSVELAQNAVPARSHKQNATFPSDRQKRFKTLTALVGALAYGLAICIIARGTSPQIEDKWQLLMTFAFSTGMTVLVLLPATLPLSASRSRGTYLLIMGLVAAISGVCINPLQQGTAALTQSDYVATSRTVAQQDPTAVWAADDSFGGQALLLASAPSINSVNTYPDLDRWRLIDPTGASEDIYNRYAHITIKLADSTSFEPIFLDAFTVRITVNDLRRLGVTYFITQDPESQAIANAAELNQVGTTGPYTIYRL